MTTLAYFARIWKDEDGFYQVEFPDVPGAITAGDTLAEALGNARDALSGVIGSMHDRGLVVPRPTTQAAPDRYLVTPEPDIAVPVLLRWTREDAGLTQVQVAERLGVTQQAYQKIERTGGNPSLKTIAKVARALGLHVAVSVEAAIAS